MKADLQSLYLTTDWGQLDCLGEVAGKGDFEDCLRSSITLQIESVIIRVLTLTALIAAKRAIGRPRDLHTVMELEVIRERLGSSKDQDGDVKQESR